MITVHQRPLPGPVVECSYGQRCFQAVRQRSRRTEPLPRAEYCQRKSCPCLTTFKAKDSLRQSPCVIIAQCCEDCLYGLGSGQKEIRLSCRGQSKDFSDTVCKVIDGGEDGRVYGRSQGISPFLACCQSTVSWALKEFARHTQVIQAPLSSPNTMRHAGSKD